MPFDSTAHREIILLEELVVLGQNQLKVLKDIRDQNQGGGSDALTQVIQLLGNISVDSDALNTTLTTFLQDWIAANTPPSRPQAVTGTVSVRGPGGTSTMALNVDSTGQNLIFQFDDDHGDIAAPPAGDGSGLVVTLASDNSAVATVGATTQGTDANGNVEYTAPLTFGTDGTFNASATVANTSGADLLDDDGTTAFVQPASVAVSVAAGQATTGTVTEG